MTALPALEFLLESGVTDFLGNAPHNFIEEVVLAKVKKVELPKAEAAKPQFVTPAAIPIQSLNAAIEQARKLADDAKDLSQLRASVEGFDGCALKKMANKTVFADGNPASRIMLIGEAPGADEDEQGIPFCGVNGHLLDKILKSIGLDRATGFYVTNTIFWRPPGNRKPTPEELAICEPFLEKHIALVNPKMLLLVGATAVAGVLKNNESMGKLRGKIFHYKNRYLQNDVPVMVTYHPSFLMRAPINKRLAWEDMLMFKAEIEKFAIN